MFKKTLKLIFDPISVNTLHSKMLRKCPNHFLKKLIFVETPFFCTHDFLVFFYFVFLALTFLKCIIFTHSLRQL
jgi:hypothetical protein